MHSFHHFHDDLFDDYAFFSCLKERALKAPLFIHFSQLKTENESNKTQHIRFC